VRSVSKVSMMGCELVGWLVGKEKEVEGTWNGWKYGVFFSFLFFSYYYTPEISLGVWWNVLC